MSLVWKTCEKKFTYVYCGRTAVVVGRKYIYSIFYKIMFCSLEYVVQNFTGHQVMVRPAKKYPPTVERLVRNMDWKNRPTAHFFDTKIS